MSIAEKLTTIAENEQKVYEAGKTAEWNEFWDEFQQKGQRTMYNGAFNNGGWTKKNFKPKYDFKIKDGCYQMFANSMYEVDLAEILSKNGVKFDYTGATDLNGMFHSCLTNHLPEIGNENITNATSLFSVAWLVTTIDKLTLAPNCSMSQAFFRCDALQNITIGNTISCNGWEFPHSKLLTHDSLMNIINKLEDKSEDTSGTVWKIAFGSENLSKLTDGEKEIVFKKGWILS